MHEEYGCKNDVDIGECWCISGDSVVCAGVYKGMHLSELWNRHWELFGDIKSDEKKDFPLLVKILDARENLSVQVHPNDSYAIQQEKQEFGKTECWYIIDCPQNAKLVVGHNANSTENLAKMIDQGNWKELLREVPVKKR